jgi:hypothetical protein
MFDPEELFCFNVINSLTSVSVIGVLSIFLMGSEKEIVTSEFTAIPVDELVGKKSTSGGLESTAVNEELDAVIAFPE